MKASPDFHVEWVGEEAVVLNPATGELHYLNPPAALTYALILEHGYKGALQQLRRSHGVRRWRDRSLKLYIQGLVEKGLLIDD